MLASAENANPILKGLPIEELEGLAASLGHSPFRGRQLFLWINQKRVSDFSEMTNLSKSFRDELAHRYALPKLKVDVAHESADGTVKYLVTLEDGQTVESVYIPAKDRATLCISTQVGCKMACRFCATGYMGFIRNMKSWEIVDQLISVPTPKPVTNIVVMGMGEPFDNYTEVRKALQIFQHPNGFQIGKKHITVSTVGVTPVIQQFIDDDLGMLAISLHGTTEEQRQKIMPINQKYPLEELMAVCRNLRLKGRKRITIEYLLIDGINDADEDARRLAKLLAGIPVKINLLAYNENPFVEFKRPSEERVLRFQKILMDRYYTVTYRRSRGRDVAAACGQLRTQLKKGLEDTKPAPQP